MKRYETYDSIVPAEFIRVQRISPRDVNQETPFLLDVDKDKPATVGSINDFLANCDDLIQAYLSNEYYPFSCFEWSRRTKQKLAEFGVQGRFATVGVNLLPDKPLSSGLSRKRHAIIVALVSSGSALNEYIFDFSANQLKYPAYETNPQEPLEKRLEIFKGNDIVPVVGPRDLLLGVYPHVDEIENQAVRLL
jgi:hypothetical protein